MTTLRREAIRKVEEILIPAYGDNPQTEEAENYAKEQAEKVVDALLELRGFYFLKTDELPEGYSIDWAVATGKKVTEKQLFKLSETKAFEDMLDEQFRRLRLNFSAFDEKAKEAFRRFIRLQPKDQTLERFVSWWLEDEWRAANPPYTLGVIMQRWLQAFTNHTDETRGEYKTDSDGLPETY